MKLVTFRLYPKRGKPHYFTAIVFDSHEAMKEHYRRCGASNVKKSPVFEAATITFKLKSLVKSRWRVSSKIGEMIFYQDGFGAGIVSHEATHAMFYWAQRMGILRNINPNCPDRTEEAMCLAQGELVSQFWVKWYCKFPESIPVGS